ncbi:hypothetical protein VN97_g7168 [Penicillium thymicola]|uniref:Uncharacterized protein n=1 Tax=Penicillium thymicola TaxID=293382 RepID=A0AAI9X731_PENTH|nr:hypothetical protein VN97_g7168 [Penicillium thymicola]
MSIDDLGIHFLITTLYFKASEALDKPKECLSAATPASVCHWHITLSLVITYNSLLYKDSPTPKLAAKRSANFLQIQFRFTSDSLQIQFS